MALDTSEPRIESLAESAYYHDLRQEKPNDPEKTENWLPAPESSFRLTSRFCGPKRSFIDGSSDTPRVVPVEG